MKALVIANLMFFPIDNWDTPKKRTAKYVQGSRSGIIFMSTIYTLEEIMKEYPDIKEVETLC